MFLKFRAFLYNNQCWNKQRSYIYCSWSYLAFYSLTPCLKNFSKFSVCYQSYVTGFDMTMTFITKCGSFTITCSSRRRNEISPSTMIDLQSCYNSQLYILVLVLDYIFLELHFSWKTWSRTLDFLILLRFICSILLSQNITTKTFLEHLLVFFLSIWLSLNVLVSILSKK